MHHITLVATSCQGPQEPSKAWSVTHLCNTPVGSIYIYTYKWTLIGDLSRLESIVCA